MKRLEAQDVRSRLKYFQVAAEVAGRAECERASCGAVIADESGDIIATGFNGPPLGSQSSSMCSKKLNNNSKPKYDKTCCVHAEWRAIIAACKSSKTIDRGTLYFMRIDDSGDFANAGEPYCTVCSRLAIESGLAEFVLWNKDGADIYPVGEYNDKSYMYHSV